MSHSRPLPRYGSVLWASLGVALLAIIGPGAARAANFEMVPFVAYRFGGVEIPTGLGCSPLTPELCTDRIKTEDSLAWGLGFAVELRGQWWMELRFSEQVAEADTELAPASAEASWDRYLIGFEYRWRGEQRDRKWAPAVSIAGGWTSLSSEVAAPGSDTELTHPTVEVGYGLLIERDERLGVRFESRLSWTALPKDLGDDIVQLGVGVSFRWKVPAL